MKARVFIPVVVFLSIVFLSITAQGVVIPLSTHSSSGPSDPNYVPASWLDASMNLSVHEGGQWALTVAVTNQTPENAGDLAFKMTELYFNTTAPITSLTLAAVSVGAASDWTLTLNIDNILCNGFGLFDIRIKSNDLSSVWIDPLETITFGIIIDAGIPPYTDTDFYDLSFQNDNHILSYAAAKFVKSGEPGDLSAYGAYVPEPATILMLGIGALALSRKRRS